MSSCQCNTTEGMEKSKLMLEALKCPKCSGPLLRHERLSSGCCVNSPSCGQIDDLTEITDLDKGIQKLEEGPKLLERSTYDAEKVLHSALQLLTKVCYPKNVYLIKIKSELARVYAKRCEWERAVQSSREAVEMIKEMHGKDSFEACNELVKLSDYEFQLLDDYDDKENILNLVRKCMVTSSTAIRLLKNYSKSFDQQKFVADLKSLEEALVCCSMIESISSKLEAQAARSRAIEGD